MIDKLLNFWGVKILWKYIKLFEVIGWSNVVLGNILEGFLKVEMERNKGNLCKIVMKWYYVFYFWCICLN